jgi:hypothetical protein
METMTRENWTDARLDDLSHRMDQGFEKIDRDIRDLRAEMNGRFDRIDARFDGMQRTLFLAAAGVVASLIGLIATQL